MTPFHAIGAYSVRYLNVVTTCQFSICYNNILWLFKRFQYLQIQKIALKFIVLCSCCFQNEYHFEGPGGSMSQIVGLPNNSYKAITNTVWVRVRLCKLQKGYTRLAAASEKVYQLLAHGRWFFPGTRVLPPLKLVVMIQLKYC